MKLDSKLSQTIKLELIRSEIKNTWTSSAALYAQ